MLAWAAAEVGAVAESDWVGLVAEAGAREPVALVAAVAAGPARLRKSPPSAPSCSQQLSGSCRDFARK